MALQFADIHGVWWVASGSSRQGPLLVGVVGVGRQPTAKAPERAVGQVGQQCGSRCANNVTVVLGVSAIPGNPRITARRGSRLCAVIWH